MIVYDDNLMIISSWFSEVSVHDDNLMICSPLMALFEAIRSLFAMWNVVRHRFFPAIKNMIAAGLSDATDSWLHRIADTDSQICQKSAGWYKTITMLSQVKKCWDREKALHSWPQMPRFAPRGSAGDEINSSLWRFRRRQHYDPPCLTLHLHLGMEVVLRPAESSILRCWHRCPSDLASSQKIYKILQNMYKLYKV